MNEEITINGITYIPKNTSKEGLNAVLIRSVNAGVHFGYLKSEKFESGKKIVTLVKTIRIWCWYGANSLSQIALEGVKEPENCKFSVELPENEICDVIETLPLSTNAVTNLYSVPIWKKQ
jgi:hypothetical protein